MQFQFTVRLMADETRITLKYDGPSVKDGTLPVDDVVAALQGFSGAYSKISHLRNDEVQHDLRLSAITPGSFDLVIVASIAIAQTPYTLHGIKLVYDGVRWVTGMIFKAIEAKKHIKNQPFSIDIDGNNNTAVIMNFEGAKLSVPPDLIELLRNKVLDLDLNKIVSPLEASRVTSAEITAESQDRPVLKEVVTDNEREYFRPINTITTKESEITGKLISLNKESNRGTFELPNGQHVPYRYSGPDADRFHMQFARKGPIRVEGTATFNENLEPTQLEIKKAENLQAELPLQIPDSN